MDVTPRELRDLDIKEKFRGYDPNEVDDLLERAAARIEALEAHVRDLSSRAQVGDAEAGKTRETEEMLHRTLLLAQRAADEAVAEAQTKARQILDDAENKSRSMVSEAETNARRQAEAERRRLETEVLEYGAKRDALVADVDALERFEQDYRARLRRAVEADLEMLSSKGSVAPSPRPTTPDVELPGGVPAATAPAAPGAAAPVAPAVPEPPAPTPAVTPAPVPPPAFGVAASAPASSAPETAAGPEAKIADAPAVAPPLAAPVPAPVAPPVPPAAPVADVAASTSSEPPWEEAASAPSAARPPLFEPEPEPDHLDDDAFFASLREAVTDETPLGPRDPEPGTPYDQDDRGGLFRRRGR
ncbi:MAG: DivIVA domain-containing protein [Acidimicrobiia bacterium]